MDSPSQRQASLAHADPSTRDTLASPHGSSSEVRRGRELLSNLAIDSGRPMRSPSLAPNMERRGVVAPSDGLPASIMMLNNVRSDGLPDVSQEREETRQQLPDEDLRQLLRLARVPQWADHIVGLGAVCVQDVAMTSAKDLAPMPILAAQRLIRFAGEAMKEELSDQDLLRAEREMRDADRVADAEQRSVHVAGGNGHDEAADEHEQERARQALEDDAEIEGRDRSSNENRYRSQHPFGVGSTIRPSSRSQH